MKNCCQLLMILAIYFCSMLAHGEEKNDDFERNSSFFERVCYLVDQMTVFPIDLIAPSGELAMTDNHGYPKMNVRYDLSYDQFENFYDFYQLSKKANQNDVEICVQKLRDQNLSPKLKIKRQLIIVLLAK